jgi:NAD(P)-dependent dehydrogenase (short-subunit alcohol dehydrogenase family)
MFSFTNANALVVGAASGIGRAMALEFAMRGARIAVADLDEAGAIRTAAKINEAGGNAIGIRCDITDASSLAAAVQAAEEFLGAIVICANSVGVLLSGNPEDIPLGEWERIFQVNVLGAARLNALVMPKMIARGSGYIVNTASVAGLHPFAITRVPYAASKAALISMSENLAIYLKPKGVLVSCLCPGPTATPIGGRATEWTAGLPVVGPGNDYVLMTAQHTAQMFCDGMEAGRVLIPSQEAISLAYMQNHAANPDHFLGQRIAQFASGDSGLPNIDFSDAEIIAAFKQLD